MRICSSLYCVAHPCRLTWYDSRLPHTALLTIIYLELRPPFSLLSHVPSIFVIYKSHQHNDLSFSFSLHRPILGSLLDNRSSIWPVVFLWQRDHLPAPLSCLVSVCLQEHIADVLYGGAPSFFFLLPLISSFWVFWCLVSTSAILRC